jgi:hypothetical protein
MSAHKPSQAGRRARFLPGVEELEDRRVPAVNFIVQGSTLFIVSPTTPGQRSSRIVITDNGGTGPNNVTAFARQPFSPNVPITNVVVNTGRGDDRVAYNLIGNLTTTRTVTASLGSGTDHFVATIRRNLLSGSGLTITANGGGGPDNLEAVIIGSLSANSRLTVNYDGGRGDNHIRVTTASFVNVGAGAALTENLNGNGGADRVVSEYQGLLSGTFQINELGGHGPNVLKADVEIATGSTGRILPSTVVGGPRNDLLTFIVHNRSTVPANNQFLDGGGGFDIAFRTTNVIVSNVEVDNVVP